MHLLGLTILTPDWPVVGNYWSLGTLFLLHMVFAQFSAGAISVAAVAEVVGARRDDEYLLHYARRMTNAYYLVFSFGASLGVFAVVALFGLWGRATGEEFNVFLPMLGLAFGLFLVIAPLLVFYKNTFGRMAPRRHAMVGLAVAFWQNLFVVMIVGLDSFLINPSHTGFVDFVHNPIYIPLLLHRLVANVSWTCLFLAGFAALRLRWRADESVLSYQAWAARLNLRIGLLLGAGMPFGGFALVEIIKRVQPGYFDNLVLGSAAFLMVIQELMLMVVFVGGNLALALEQPGRGMDPVGRVAAVLAFLGMALGVMPAQVLAGDLYWLRYAGIGFASVITGLYVLARTFPAKEMPRLAPAPGAAVALPFTCSLLARRLLMTVGLTSVALSLFMGYIKEETRGSYAVYGELTQQDARGQFTPGGGIYPP